MNSVSENIESEIEEWKDIQGFEGLYQASSHGRIKSVERTEMCLGGVRRRAEKILKPWILRSGYLMVAMSKDGRVTHKSVHRIVLSTFRPGGTGDANHINFVRSDNRLKNLEWCTRKQNIHHSRAHGRWTKEASRKGGVNAWKGKSSDDRKAFGERMAKARISKRESACGLQ